MLLERVGRQRQGQKQFNTRTICTFCTGTLVPSGKRVRGDRIFLLEMAVVNCWEDESEDIECSRLLLSLFLVWEAIRIHDLGMKLCPRYMKPGELSNDEIAAHPQCRVMTSVGRD